jgi:phage/plasmid primase-like uncharacterized protein
VDEEEGDGIKACLCFGQGRDGKKRGFVKGNRNGNKATTETKRRRRKRDTKRNELKTQSKEKVHTNTHTRKRKEKKRSDGSSCAKHSMRSHVKTDSRALHPCMCQVTPEYEGRY